MRLPFQQTLLSVIASSEVRHFQRAFAWMDWLTCYCYFGSCAALCESNAIGLASHYYTVAVTSMLQSWHNFFFVAAEPGGSVSVDKPPLGLWVQAISAYFLGVSGFSVVLPEILAGIFSVIVLYHLVRRSFSVTVGVC